jgi:hypothetical protein
VFFGSTVPRGDTIEAEDGGQYGGKMSFYVAALNDMDLAVYAANYHSRLPVLSGTSRSGATAPASTATYFVEYPEDIQLYGLSFNTTVPWLDVALQGEYSLKRGQPLQIDDVELLLAGLGAPGQILGTFAGAQFNQTVQGWRRFDIDQVDISVTKILGPLAWMGYDQLSMFVEACLLAGIHRRLDEAVNAAVAARIGFLAEIVHDLDLMPPAQVDAAIALGADVVFQVQPEIHELLVGVNIVGFLLVGERAVFHDPVQRPLRVLRQPAAHVGAVEQLYRRAGTALGSGLGPFRRRYSRDLQLASAGFHGAFQPVPFRAKRVDLLAGPVGGPIGDGKFLACQRDAHRVCVSAAGHQARLEVGTFLRDFQPRRERTAVGVGDGQVPFANEGVVSGRRGDGQCRRQKYRKNYSHHSLPVVEDQASTFPVL